MSKRVLITGIGGFAGRYLSPLLADGGYEVFGITGRETASDIDGLSEGYACDLRDEEQTFEVVSHIMPTHVVHLAAISFVAHSDVREIYNTNIVGSRNLLSALTNSKCDVKSVLLVSSANVYGNSTRDVLSENDPIDPVNDYAVSKIAMEYMARQFRSLLNIVIARPFNYTGQGQSNNFLVPKIVSHFNSGAKYIELGNTDISRDFSDVRDVCRYFKALIESPGAVGETFNICSGRGQSLKSIIEMCEALTGRKMDVRVNPSFFRPNEVKSLVGSADKLGRLAGEAALFSMKDTLQWMLDLK